MEIKTNAMRILESEGVSFSITTYEVEEEYLDAMSSANKIGVDPESVFKTLVAKNEKNAIFVFVVPANCEVNMKKAAKLTGSKHVKMVKLNELTGLTGYIRGGCSPLGMKKKYPTFIDELAQANDKIYVNGGSRGLLLHLPPEDLCRVCNATFADLT